MFGHSVLDKEEDDLMFPMEEDEISRRGSSYRSSEYLCCASSVGIELMLLYYRYLLHFPGNIFDKLDIISFS